MMQVLLIENAPEYRMLVYILFFSCLWLCLFGSLPLLSMTRGIWLPNTWIEGNDKMRRLLWLYPSWDMHVAFFVIQINLSDVLSHLFIEGGCAIPMNLREKRIEWTWRITEGALRFCMPFEWHYSCLSFGAEEENIYDYCHNFYLTLMSEYLSNRTL